MKPFGHFIVDIDANDIGELKTFYDTQSIDGSVNSVRFFPPNPTGNILVQNYENQPFDGIDDFFLVGMGFAPKTPFFHAKTADSMDPQHLLNALAQMVVVMKPDAGNRTEVEVPLPLYYRLDNATPFTATHHETDALGDGATPDEDTGLALASAPIVNLAQPFLLQAGTPFYLTVEFPTAVGTLINAMTFTNQPGDFGLICSLQFARINT